MICGLDGDVGLRLRDVIEAANGLSWQGPFQGSPAPKVLDKEIEVMVKSYLGVSMLRARM